jgi:hypothetical protein
LFYAKVNANTHTILFEKRITCPYSFQFYGIKYLYAGSASKLHKIRKISEEQNTGIQYIASQQLAKGVLYPYDLLQKFVETMTPGSSTLLVSVQGSAPAGT